MPEVKKNGPGTVLALKYALRALGVVLLFAAGLFATDFVGLRTWVGEHKTATVIHQREYEDLRLMVDKQIAEQTKLLEKIAKKLEVD